MSDGFYRITLYRSRLPVAGCRLPGVGKGRDVIGHRLGAEAPLLAPPQRCEGGPPACPAGANRRRAGRLFGRNEDSREPATRRQTWSRASGMLLRGRGGMRLEAVIAAGWKPARRGADGLGFTDHRPPTTGNRQPATFTRSPLASASADILPAEARVPPRRRQGCRRSESVTDHASTSTGNRQPATVNRQPATDPRQPITGPPSGRCADSGSGRTPSVA
jgi:hypothetical protein